MPVIIDELLIDVQPGQHTASESALPQAAEGDTANPLVELLELLREREERLRCD